MGSVKLCSIPEDILIRIFLCGITNEFRLGLGFAAMAFLLNISHTNQALRRLTLSTPCLWSTLGTIVIGLKDEGVLNLFRLWIERSGEVPLNYKIDIRWNTPAANDLINLFFEQKYRWRSAKVFFAESSPYLPFPSSGLKNMPCLQKLSITIRNLNAVFQLKTDIDLSESTQLRNLCLKWVNSSL